MAMICDKENRNNVNLSQPSAENKTLTEIPRSFCGHSKAKQKLFREVVNESCVVSFAA